MVEDAGDAIDKFCQFPSKFSLQHIGALDKILLTIALYKKLVALRGG